MQINEWKNKYTAELKKWQDKDYKVRLVFSAPVTLHTTSKLRDDVTASEHIVNGLFFTGRDGSCNCMHDDTETVGIYYKPLKRRSSGYPLMQWGQLQSFEFIDMTQDYGKEWEKIAKSMRKNNINLNIADSIEKHLRGEAEHIEGFQNYWKRTDKPTIASFADVVGYRTLADMARTATESEYTKGRKVFHERRNGIKRDRSITLETRGEGTARPFFQPA